MGAAAVSFHLVLTFSCSEGRALPPPTACPSLSLPVICKASVVAIAFFVSCQHGAKECTLCDRLTVPTVSGHTWPLPQGK